MRTRLVGQVRHSLRSSPRSRRHNPRNIATNLLPLTYKTLKRFSTNDTLPFDQSCSLISWQDRNSHAFASTIPTNRAYLSAQAIPDTTLPAVVSESEESAAAVAPSQLFSLKNKTFLITGGGRGLGLSLAGAIVDAGGHAACIDILPEPSDEEWAALQSQARYQGTEVTYHTCDITNEDAVTSVVTDVSKRASDRGASLFGAVTAAGIIQKIETLEYPASDFENVLRVNILGTFITAKAVAKEMANNGIKGSIVMVASMSGNIANRGLKCSAYNSSKAAVQQLCRSMAQELGPAHGIRVNTLSPGYIRTKMTDQLLKNEPEIKDIWMAGAMLNRIGAPEDFHGPAVFLLSRASSFMTGGDLRVDGGHTASA